MSDEPSTSTGVLMEEEAMQLIAFLVSASELCIKEPTYYGTFRLIDAASRLMGFMLQHNPSRTSEFLQRFKEEVDTKKVWMMFDRQAYFDFLQSAPAQVAAEVKRLTDEDRASQKETPA
ncbi:MAG: hypothetical protein QOJ59_3033 [Thermomicrobiales bacterium]|jgi:hypothetical protein|nr:hypothetical protein [Thermomicrobiales bacterium]MEA2527996.1 hypothetical protein [Thermomicrobiales bacterium]